MSSDWSFIPPNPGSATPQEAAVVLRELRQLAMRSSADDLSQMLALKDLTDWLVAHARHQATAASRRKR